MNVALKTWFYRISVGQHCAIVGNFQISYMVFNFCLFAIGRSAYQLLVRFDTIFFQTLVIYASISTLRHQPMTGFSSIFGFGTHRGMNVKCIGDGMLVL